MAETYTAGYVTAYGAAVRGGYTGTYEEFCAEQAKFAENAAAVAQAKEDVASMQDQVEQAAATFTGTTVPAAVATVQEAGADQVQAVQSEGTMQAAAVETVGAQQTAAVGAAGSDAADAVEAAETAATEAVSSAQAAAVQAVQTESSTQQAAVQAKGEEVLASIPEDYTELSNDVDDLKSSLNHTIIDTGASIVNSNTVGRYNTRVDIVLFDAIINNSYEVDVSIDSAASADIYFYVKDENDVTVVQVRMPSGNTSKTMTFTAASSGQYTIMALAMTTMTKTATATVINKSGFIQTVNSDVVNVYGTGLIYPVTVSSDNFVMKVAENAVINYKLRNGTFKSKSISANTTYTIAPQDALIIDSSDNTIKQIGRINIKPSHVVLLATGAYVSGYTRYFDGYFADRVTVQTTYEDFLLKNVDKSYVRDVDDKITEIVNENPCDFSVIIATDMHISESSAYSTNRPIINVMNRIHSRIDADMIMNIGDNVAMGKENPDEAYYSIQDAVGRNNDIRKCYFAVGNHDYNNISGVRVDRQKIEWIIPDDAMFRMYGRLHENDVVWGSKDKVYYYKDFNDKKIRVIVLNTLDKPNDTITVDSVEYEKYPWLPNIVSADQVDWLIDEALDFSDKSDKTSWAVMIFSHVTPAPNMEWNAASLGALDSTNPQGAEIIKIAEAFVGGTSKTLSYTDTIYGGSATLSRTVDFTSQGAIPIIGWFSGHSHIDTKATINGVTYVTTVCGYPDDSIGNSQSMSGMSMIDGTYTAFGLDVASIDKTNRKVNLYRVGIGNDREWTY